jgi:hypothetical protein
MTPSAMIPTVAMVASAKRQPSVEPNAKLTIGAMM